MKMREIEVSMLTDVIEKLCIEANEHLPSDVKIPEWHASFWKSARMCISSAET